MQCKRCTGILSGDNFLFSFCQHLDRVKSRKKNSREALSLLWTLGQTSDHTDFMERMRGMFIMSKQGNLPCYKQLSVKEYDWGLYGELTTCVRCH